MKRLRVIRSMRALAVAATLMLASACTDDTPTTVDPPPITADPPAFSTDPSLTVADPSPTAAEPPPITADPPAVVADPSPTVPDASSTASEPSPITPDPSAASPDPSPSVADPPPTLAEPPPMAADPSPTVAAAPEDEDASAATSLAAYRALSASRARDYDRTQDISPRQLLILLEVCERTEAKLGLVLATGEHESARTWNDYVRPTLKSGNLGSATGVWQFIPGTFHRIVKGYGSQLLALSEADASTNRERLDLGDGHFSDERVRQLIQETVDGRRGADDEELQLLRHNFAVLAFAKHYLSLDSGAKTPEEDYLYHFLGEGEGRRVLALARGEARHTLAVKPVEPVEPVEPAAPLAEPPTTLATAEDRQRLERAAALLRSGTLVPAEPSRPTGTGTGLMMGTQQQTRVTPQWGLSSSLQRPPLDRAIATIEARSIYSRPSAPPAEPAIWSPPVPAAPPRPSSQWGFPADSPVVTGNLGMFYRDGKGQSQPYTWAEFMEHLARRVRAKDQPALVRAKYGVGFPLAGGDRPERAFKPETVTKAAEFRHSLSADLRLPEALILGTLDAGETGRYKRRLAELIRAGADQPTATLPPESLAALHHLRLLPLEVREPDSRHPRVSQALRDFRVLVGKQEPDDPAHRDLLMPAERIALEIYDQRIAYHAALQAAQVASMDGAADLSRIRTMPTGLRKNAAPHVAVLQDALAERGMLKPLTRKVVWRDKKRKKHVSYQPAPFTGYAGKLTLAAIDDFQWRHGLRRTEGVADAVTLAMLGLPPMGPEIFRPIAGPYCSIDSGSEPASACATPTGQEARAHGIGDVIPRWSRAYRIP